MFPSIERRVATTLLPWAYSSRVGSEPRDLHNWSNPLCTNRKFRNRLFLTVRYASSRLDLTGFRLLNGLLELAHPSAGALEPVITVRR
jgi:hypothetical protein